MHVMPGEGKRFDASFCRGVISKKISEHPQSYKILFWIRLKPNVYKKIISDYVHTRIKMNVKVLCLLATEISFVFINFCFLSLDVVSSNKQSQPPGDQNERLRSREIFIARRCQSPVPSHWRVTGIPPTSRDWNNIIADVEKDVSFNIDDYPISCLGCFDEDNLRTSSGLGIPKQQVINLAKKLICLTHLDTQERFTTTYIDTTYIIQGGVMPTLGDGYFCSYLRHPEKTTPGMLKDLAKLDVYACISPVVEDRCRQSIPS